MMITNLPDLRNLPYLQEKDILKLKREMDLQNGWLGYSWEILWLLIPDVMVEPLSAFHDHDRVVRIIENYTNDFLKLSGNAMEKAEWLNSYENALK